MDLETWKFALDYIFHYIYKTPKASFEDLTEEQIKYIQTWQPRTQAEHFPDEYPDETGYDGTHWQLYRGIFCKSEEEFQRLVEEVEKGSVTYNDITSWSNHPTIADAFARGAGFYSYTDDHSIKGFKGVVLVADPIYKDSTFFSSTEAGDNLEEEYEGYFEDLEPEQIYHSGEEEIVLLPGTFPVKIHKIMDLDKEEGK